MQNERLEKVLTDIGLSAGEARLYLTMLANGPSPILRLAKLSGLKRTTIYTVIERLQQFGIARVDVRGLKRLFVAEPPDRLEAVLASRKSLLTRHLGDLEKIAGAGGDTSFLKYYEGLAAVEGIYENILVSARGGDEYLALSDQAQWEELDKDFFPRYQERRARSTFKVRLILQDSPSARHSQEFARNINAQVRILPEGTNLSTNLVVTPQRVLIHQLSAPIIGIVIENKSVIQMHREMFEVIWKSLSD